MINQGVQASRVVWLLLALLGCYLLGWLYPTLWWASNSLAFIPPLASIVLLLIVVAVLIDKWSIQKGCLSLMRGFVQLPYPAVLLFNLIVSGLAGYMFLINPIVIDGLGDVLRFEGSFSGPDGEFKQSYLNTLLSWNILDFQNGERTVLNLAHFMSAIFEVDPRRAFEWLSAGSGALFVFFVLSFARIYSSDARVSLSILLMGLLAPVCWMFFGHMEIYAPTIVLVFAYVALLLLFFNKPSAGKLLLLLVLLYLCIRFHTVNYLLVPTFVMATMKFFYRDDSAVLARLNWKNTVYGLFVPVALAGSWLYFFKFEDYKDPRLLAPLKEQIFLPMLSPMAPLDRYNLFSTAHLFDTAVYLLLLSAAAFFVVLAAALCCFRLVRWNELKVLSLGSTLILYLVFYFVLNPLLGMPLDIDLYSIHAPLLILFAVVLLEQLSAMEELDTKGVARNLLKGVMVLSLFTLPLLYVQQDEQASAQKFKHLGIRTFQTYWMGADRPILLGMLANNNSQQQFAAYVESVLPKIEPWLHPSQDLVYVDLLVQVGYIYRYSYNRLDLAYDYHRKALPYDEGDLKNRLALMELSFLRGEYDEAYQHSEYLVAMKHPNLQKALRISMHCAVMAGHYESARLRAESYHELWPTDQFIEQVLRKLDKGHYEELRRAFNPR